VLCSAYVHVVAQLNASAAYQISILPQAGGSEGSGVSSDELLGAQPLETRSTGKADELVFRTLAVPVLFEGLVQNYAPIVYTTAVQVCIICVQRAQKLRCYTGQNLAHRSVSCSKKMHWCGVLHMVLRAEVSHVTHFGIQDLPNTVIWPVLAQGNSEQVSPEDLWAAAPVSPAAGGVAPRELVTALANVGDTVAGSLPAGADTLSRQQARTPVPSPPLYHRKSGALMQLYLLAAAVSTTLVH
jgi:hypothetical protein